MVGLLGEGVLRVAGGAGGIRCGRRVSGDDGHSCSAGQVRPQEVVGGLRLICSLLDQMLEGD